MKPKKDTLKLVKEFSDFFSHEFNETVTTPPQDKRDLRIKLSLEETTELAEACGRESVNNYITLLQETIQELMKNEYPEDVDIYGVADALADKRYIDDGTIGLFGLARAFPELFADVHDANMSKRTKSTKVVLDTIAFYAKKGVEAYYEQKEGYFLIFRKEDGKVLKPTSWREPNNKPIIDKYL